MKTGAGPAVSPETSWPSGEKRGGGGSRLGDGVSRVDGGRAGGEREGDEFSVDMLRVRPVGHLRGSSPDLGWMPGPGLLRHTGVRRSHVGPWRIRERVRGSALESEADRGAWGLGPRRSRWPAVPSVLLDPRGQSWVGREGTGPRPLSVTLVPHARCQPFLLWLWMLSVPPTSIECCPGLGHVRGVSGGFSARLMPPWAPCFPLQIGIMNATGGTGPFLP